MSFFATITGYVEYRTIEHLQAALDRLQRGGWLDDEYRWYPEGQHVRVSHAPTVAEADLLLVVPFDHYRNLGRVTTELFPGAVAGVLVSSSTDGCFDAWVERPRPEAAHAPADLGDDGAARVSTIKHIDLVAFARERGLGVKSPPTTAPHEYVAWQDRVCRAFHRAFDPALPADVPPR